MLDEFALSLYMRDVYWAEQGRTSVDAVSSPSWWAVSSWSARRRSSSGRRRRSRLALAIAVGVNSLLAAVTLLKGKLLTGAVSIFVPRSRSWAPSASPAALAVGPRPLQAPPPPSRTAPSTARASVRRADEPAQGPPGRRAEQARLLSRLARDPRGAPAPRGPAAGPERERGARARARHGAGRGAGRRRDPPRRRRGRGARDAPPPPGGGRGARRLGARTRRA